MLLPTNLNGSCSPSFVNKMIFPSWIFSSKVVAAISIPVSFSFTPVYPFPSTSGFEPASGFVRSNSTFSFSLSEQP
jgi:hypothetical protein